VNGQRGQALTTLSFDSTKADQAPPYLKRFRVLMDGEASSQTVLGHQNQLSLLVADEVGLAQVQAYYQTLGTWQPLALPLPSGPTMETLVDLPAGLPEGPVNMRFLASDAAGNSLVQEWTPAFYHGRNASLVIVTQPQNTSVLEGRLASFSVEATGAGPLAYQWRKRGVAIPGATSSSYTTPAQTSEDNGATFSVVVSNAQGSVTSRDATLTVLVPAVDVQPATLSCFPGEEALFTAKVTQAEDTRVLWTTNAGIVSAEGHFTAAATPGTVTITATSVAAPSQKGTAKVMVRGTDFDANAPSNPKLLDLANAIGSTAPSDLAKYDFNGDGKIDDADLVKLFQKMGW
jgi:hypothetical protein